LNQQKATFDKLKDKTTNGINADAKNVSQFPDSQTVKREPDSMMVMNERLAADNPTINQNGISDDDVVDDKMRGSKRSNNEDMPQEFHELFHKGLVQPTKETPPEQPNVLSPEENRLKPKK